MRYAWVFLKATALAIVIGPVLALLLIAEVWLAFYSMYEEETGNQEVEL